MFWCKICFHAEKETRYSTWTASCVWIVMYLMHIYSGLCLEIRHHGFNVKLKSTDISHRRLIPHRSLQSRVACVTKCLFYLHYTRIYTFFFVNKPVFLCTVLPQMNCVLKVIFNRDFNCNLYYHREWMIYEVIWDKAV